MKVLIIEDEPMAQSTLAKKLLNGFRDMEIVGMTSSVQNSVEWLKENEADVIFMDVELSDGISFEIFRQVEIKADVIMTTAYDNYAVKAFEQGSVDYLLKPIDQDALERAVSRVQKNKGAAPADWMKLVNSLQEQIQANQKPSISTGKERFIVRFNDKIVPVRTSEIAYFYSEDKNNFLMTTSGNSYVVDAALDDIYADLDGSRFFKISRSCLVNITAVGTITRQLGGRLKIEAVPTAPFEMTVSRSRCDDFLAWLER